MSDFKTQTQPDLFGTVTEPRFDGPVYDHEKDYARLNKQQQKIVALMKDAAWRTLRLIHELTGEPEASISAQLRHLRKPKFGSHIVEKRNVGGGLWEYRLILNAKS